MNNTINSTKTAATVSKEKITPRGTKQQNSTMSGVLAYISVFLVAVLLAFNYQLFIVENNFAPAGLNGIATMIQYKTGFSIGFMSLLINIPLGILSYFLIDKEFGKRSIFFCLTYSLVFLLLQKLGLEEFQYVAENDTIFPVLLSGVISGYVYGVTFRANSSTGGTHFIAKYISKIRPQINFFWINFLLNAIVGISSFFVYAQPDGMGGMIYNYKPVCLCIVYCFVSSFIGDYIIKGTKVATKFTVITTHPQEIMEEASREFRHSLTHIEATGSFTHDKKSVLICVINKHQIMDFKKMLAKYDDTFSFSETVNETFGNFKKI